ncbi:hypothetical protein HCG49_17015 [Arenibacter sp. 6A1]|uniref:hypothetical protein n=1 Tax=Arenibacter sp. 6A1 TaxID=2720391 RepID=UPI001447F6ED|nr:hypothetical protein [Arenibacter sp. 6A1]NKI28257.1 hypothetical protein [Arenibacter sp. 6A1]
MIDKTLEIKAFIKANYCPGTLNNTKPELQLNNHAILELLFQVFPVGCIDDYDLQMLLGQLGYTPQKKDSLDFVWCLLEID